ncbi:MAG: AbrB/MazE/SpoVT family DNA-binding domain-containing protein [Nitrospinae bacterium]|nr:AbrB/MazE/SpoVT family DNA-binding domain-containing protein [Nitrospinota bacterium]
MADEIIEVVEVTDEGQITIPKKMRKQEQIMPHQRLFAMDLRGYIVLSKMNKDPVKGFITTLNTIAGNSEWNEFRHLREEAENQSRQKMGKWK